MSNNKNNSAFEGADNIEEIKDDAVVGEVSDNAEETATAAEVDVVSDDTQVEYDENGKKKKNKKNKPKMPKKKKIIIWVVSVVLVLAIIGGAIGGFFLWLGDPPEPGDISRDKLELNPPVYYIGDANDTNKKGEVIEGAWNVDNYADLVQYLKDGKDVVIHAKELVMTADLGTINLKSDIYGNGAILDANAIVSKDGNAIEIGANDSAVKIYDLWITGKKVIEETDSFSTFDPYGTMIKINSTDPNKSAKAEIKHCILENGYKVLHIEKHGDVIVEGTIVRNASDTPISIGTFANLKNKVYLKNNVIAGALSAGITVYSYVKSGPEEVTEENAANSWAEVTIEGFLDVYNWKSTKNLVFVPYRELQNQTIMDVVSTVTSTKIAPFDEYQEMKVTLEEENEFFDESEEESEENSRLVKNQYIHLAITRISSAGLGKNEAKFIYKDAETEKRNGLKIEELPMPSMAKAFLKECYAWSYLNENTHQVKIHETINSNTNIYKELVEGRTYKD